MMALEFENFEQNKRIIDRCIERGVLTDWFLFAPHCLRIAPPLTITEKQIAKACKILLRVLKGFQKNECCNQIPASAIRKGRKRKGDSCNHLTLIRRQKTLSFAFFFINFNL